MRVRYARHAVGCLIAISGPAWAGESLINSATLQYNYAYACRGERVVVAGCRDSDDNSLCRVVLPDRPYVNGLQADRVFKRGEVIAKLNSCVRPKPAAVASAAAPPSPSRPSPAPTTNTTPGLGDASWSMLDMDEERALFFTPATIKRTSGSAISWFTTVYMEPTNFGGKIAESVKFTQGRYEANCAKRLLKLTDVATYDENGKQVSAGPLPGATWDSVEPGTRGAEELNILCGRPQPLAFNTPVTGDHETIDMFYLLKMTEAAHEAQMKGGRKHQ